MADDLLPGETRLFDEAAGAIVSWGDSIAHMHDPSASVAGAAHARERVLAHELACRHARVCLRDAMCSKGPLHVTADNCTCVCCRERFFQSLLASQEAARGTRRHDRELYIRALVGLAQALVEGGHCLAACKSTHSGAACASLPSIKDVFRTLLWFGDEHMQRAEEALRLLDALASAQPQKAMSSAESLARSSASLPHDEDTHAAPRGASACSALERAAIDAEARIVLGDWSGVIERHYMVLLRSADSSPATRRLAWSVAVASCAQWLESMLARGAASVPVVEPSAAEEDVQRRGSAFFSCAVTPQRNGSAIFEPAVIGDGLAAVCAYARTSPDANGTSPHGGGALHRLIARLFAGCDTLHARDAARVLAFLGEHLEHSSADRAVANLVAMRTRGLLLNLALTLPARRPASLVSATLLGPVSELAEALSAPEPCEEDALALARCVCPSLHSP